LIEVTDTKAKIIAYINKNLGRGTDETL